MTTTAKKTPQQRRPGLHIYHRRRVSYEWEGRVYTGIVYEFSPERDVIEIYLAPGLLRCRFSDLLRCDLRAP